MMPIFSYSETCGQNAEVHFGGQVLEIFGTAAAPSQSKDNTSKGLKALRGS